MFYNRRQVLAVICVLPMMLLVVLSADRVVAQDTVSVSFAFFPAQASYQPGQNVTLNVTVMNTGLYNREKVTNISMHFGWMAPNSAISKDFSGLSAWLAPGGSSGENYSMRFQIPLGIVEMTYSYSLIINYVEDSAWGPIASQWGLGTTYRDFVVAKDLGTIPNENTLSWLPYVAIGALVIAVAAIAMVFYTRRGKAVPLGVAAASAGSSALMGGQTQAGVMAYPVIHPMPGEGFPVEKGFIYLVKEKRPNMGFAMYSEATRHGAIGMLVAREHPNRLKQMHQFEAAKILWLTRRVGMDHIDPTELSLLSLEVSKFIESTTKSVVLLEGLEYVITQNDFESVLRFVNHMHDFVLAHDSAVIIVIDPRVLSTRELALLERSARIVEPAEKQNDAAPAPTEEEPA